MLSIRLARALDKVHVLLTHARVLDVLGPLRPFATGSRPEMTQVLQAYAGIVAGRPQLGEPEREVLASLQLSMLLDPEWWARVTQAVARTTTPESFSETLPDICARLQFVDGCFPLLSRLLEEAREAEPEGNRLVVVLPGKGGEPPQMPRLAAVIEAIGQIWTVGEGLTNKRGSLRLVGTEPGVNTGLHFDGPEEPLEEMRSILTSIWDQTARLQHLPAEQHPLLVPEMLPVMERLNRSRRADAPRMRTALETGVRALLEEGCALRGYAPKSGPVGLATGARTSGGAARARAAGEELDALEDDLGHLAQVIAEERRALSSGEPAERGWVGSGSEPGR